MSRNLPINFLTRLQNDEFSGFLMREPDVPMTVGHAVKTALFSRFTGEELPIDEQQDRFWLARDIVMACKGDGILEVSVKDRELCKKLVGKTWAPLVSGQVAEILDGKTGVVPPLSESKPNAHDHGADTNPLKNGSRDHTRDKRLR